MGFPSNALFAFIPLAAAFGAARAGILANRIFYSRARLPEFKMRIPAAVVFFVFVFAGPLLDFAPRIAQAKRIGLREYGTLGLAQE